MKEQVSQKPKVIRRKAEEITNSRRGLILELADGYEDALRIIHVLESFNHREDLYRWLLRRGVKGADLVELNFKYGALGISNLFLKDVKSASLI